MLAGPTEQMNSFFSEMTSQLITAPGSELWFCSSTSLTNKLFSISSLNVASCSVLSPIGNVFDGFLKLHSCIFVSTVKMWLFEKQSCHNSASDVNYNIFVVFMVCVQCIYFKNICHALFPVCCVFLWQCYSATCRPGHATTSFWSVGVHVIKDICRNIALFMQIFFRKNKS